MSGVSTPFALLADAVTLGPFGRDRERRTDEVLEVDDRRRTWASESHSYARAELVRAVREASRQGLTQAQIAQLMGRSQPEVSRLLRFHGRGPLAPRLRQHAREVRELIDHAGGSNVRVFGSVATGTEHAGSDIDLLFDMDTAMSLTELGVLERRLSELLGTHVDLIPASALRPDLRERVLAEVVAL